MRSEDRAGKTTVDAVKGFGIVQGKNIPVFMKIIKNFNQVFINILVRKASDLRSENLP